MVVLGRVDMVHRGKLSLWRFSFSFFPEDFQQKISVPSHR
jgi:hypothetical protein